MNAQINPSLSCPKGHGFASMPGSHFCNTCGERLLSSATPRPIVQPTVQRLAPQQFQNLQAQPLRPIFQNQAQPFPQAPNGFRPPQGFPPAQNFAPVQQFVPAPFNGQMYRQGQAFGAQNQAQTYCNVCGGNGTNLNAKIIVCSLCRWLRPLTPGYRLDCEAFLWAQDGAAMSKLRAMSSLNSVARAISDKVGRRWIETTFNAIRLSERQLPEVYAQAVRAARILGMSYMPDVYVSGDRMWDAMIFGSDNNAFLVLGTALITNFRGDDLLFVLAREMGHCRAGHALWKTVIRFLVGEMAPRGGLMAGGLFSAVSKMMNPTQLVESALELPLLAWARQAEITADRAGLLAVGDEAITRRVLLSWSLKSSMLCQQINIEEWLAQENGDDQMTQLSEMLSSSTPYITRRLKLIQQFAGEPQMQYWREMIKSVSPVVPLPVATNSSAPVQAAAPQNVLNASAPKQEMKANDDAIKLNCGNCKTAMRVPKAALAGKTALNVKCPNAQCGKVITLKKQTAPAATPKQKTQLNNEANLSVED